MSNQKSSELSLDSPVSFMLEGELLKADTPQELLQKIGEKLDGFFLIELTNRAIIEKVNTVRGTVEKRLGYCELIVT